MLDRLGYYDVIGIVVPGTLLVYWIPICFPQLVQIVPPFPEGIDFVGFAALALFAGHIIQALGSLVERPLYWTWGGRPSDRALAEGLGDRYLTADAAVRIRSKLLAVVGPDASDPALFQWGMRRAASVPSSRSEIFNALYGFHRALLVFVGTSLILLLVSIGWGAAENWSSERIAALSSVLVGLFVLLYFRTQQRALYYVAEVMHIAERSLPEGQ